MTKTQAREFLKRCHEAIRDAEAALKTNDEDALMDACLEIVGSAATIESALDYDYDGTREGIRGF